jgi:hypothetical protein
VNFRELDRIKDIIYPHKFPKPTMIQPSQVPQITHPKRGFNDYVERLNGRAAMVGFIAAILVELLTGEGVLSWLGLR